MARPHCYLYLYGLSESEKLLDLRLQSLLGL